MTDQTQVPAPDRPDELGRRLQSALGDGYVVEDRLGTGGFAAVYRVRDIALKRALAVKVLAPDLIATHTALERFRREAATVAQLSHPNIVPLHFIGQQDDLAYLVMQAVGGGTLADRLRREPRLGVDEAARVFADVANALAHAHARGVIHRDIKPQNILLDADTGRALVTDFGIARTMDSSALTATGIVLGTAAYLSPEQLTGDAADHRADIYALGVIAYEMLAGRPPFVGETPNAAVMKRITTAPAPVRTMRPDVPVLLADLVDRCLATDPGDRPTDAADIARALTGESPVSALLAGTVRTTAPRRSSATRMRAGVVVAIVAATLLGVAYANRDQASTANAPALTQVDSGMVLVPAGAYLIGTNDGPVASGPAHTVTLAAFGIGAHEVTIGEYEPYVAIGSAVATWTPESSRNAPVTSVLLAEAAGFCAWRHGAGGRLPTEQEWEAAARGVTARRYPWGNEWLPGAANVAAPQRGVAPVGSHPAGRTAEGLDDMIGNAWEWTSSPYAPYGAPGDSTPEQRVIRGGGFNTLREFANASYRGNVPPNVRADLAATGFRCAMSPRADSTSAQR